MSFSRARRVLPARLKIRTNFRCSGFKVVSQSRSAMPMMAFSGVRISWLMLARNSLLPRLAISAASLAFCRWTSACWRSVLSRLNLRAASLVTP